MFQHLFFDLDHTLWDFESNSVLSLQSVFDDLKLQQRGIDNFDDFQKTYHQHNHKMWDRFRKGFINRDTLRWKRFWLALLDFKVADEALAHAMSDRYLDYLPLQTKLMDGALDILEYTRDKGYHLHIITNGFEATQHQKLKNSGIDHFFEHVITSEAAMALKPKPEIYSFAEQQCGSNKSNSLIIGDTPEADILGANNSGWKSIYFNPLNQASDIPSTYTIQHLSEIKTIL